MLTLRFNGGKLTIPKRAQDDSKMANQDQITQLYRHYDAHGKLLYVGISLNVMSRRLTHEATSPWFLEVVRIEIEHYPSRDEASRAEKSAIRRERPQHNVMNQPGPISPRLKYAPEIAPIPRAPDIVFSNDGVQTFSIDAWCEHHDLSRSFFYQLAARGEGPRTFKVGRCTRISKAADAEWVAARELAQA
jgi:predicted DNA-binding transcriptional regulator AlpA